MRAKLTISLPDGRYERVLRDVAASEHDGNVSEAVRRLIETSPVTKSRLALSGAAPLRA